MTGYGDGSSGSGLGGFGHADGIEPGALDEQTDDARDDDQSVDAGDDAPAEDTGGDAGCTQDGERDDLARQS